MPRATDWKIGERRRIRNSPEYHALTMNGVRDLLATGDDEDRQVAFDIARQLLELEFDSDAELLAQLGEVVPA